MGFFPNERQPRVAYCGVEASSNLAQLASGIGAVARIVGYPAGVAALCAASNAGAILFADWARKAHAALASNLKSYEFGSARESEFHLYESILKPSGSEYKRLATYSFVKDAA